jgi:hypothetical protein
MKTEQIAMLRTATRDIVPGKGQDIILSARKGSYEIWQREPIMFVTRIPRKQVLWVIPK